MTRHSVARVPLRFEFLEERQVPAGGVLAVAPDVGGAPVVRVLAEDGSELARFMAFESSFTGGVRLSMGDVTGNGVHDIIAGAGQGGAPLVRVFDGETFEPIAQFFAYEPSFRGGVHVATGDFSGSGTDQIIVGAGVGGGPLVRVFGVVDGGDRLFSEFFAYSTDFRGGVHVAAGNFDGIPGDEVITGAGVGGAPHVRVFGLNGTEKAGFFAYDPSVRGGVSVAAGDLNGDGFSEIVTGPGVGGGPHVRIFEGGSGQQINGFFAYNPEFRNGVRVGVGDANGDGRPDVITGAGPGGGPHMRAFDGRTGEEVAGEFSFDPSFRGGLFVTGRRVSAISGRNAGHFENPLPTSAVVTLAENTIAWGEPFDGPNGGRSSMIFHSNPFRGTSNEVFSLGALTYVNNVTFLGTEADSVELVVTVRPEGAQAVDIRIPMSMDNTPNTGDPDADADTVTLPASIPSQVIAFEDGTIRTLEFFGFARRREDVLTRRVTRFTVPEGGWGAVGLYARFVDLPASRDYQIRPLGSGSTSIPAKIFEGFKKIKPGISADFVLFEIRDIKNNLSSYYYYQGLGVSAGLNFNAGLTGNWTRFTTSAPMTVRQFEGTANLLGVDFTVGPISVNDLTLHMTGTPLGVKSVHVRISPGSGFALTIGATSGPLEFIGISK